MIPKEAEGLHARIVQHEYDHLEGVLYTKRLAHKDAFGFEKEIEKYWKINEEKKLLHTKKKTITITESISKHCD